MFGQTNQSAIGSPTAQNPSMLDSVTAQDFQSAQSSQPIQTQPMDTGMNNSAYGQQPAFQQPDPTFQPFDQSSSQTQQHPLTTDNPFLDDSQQTTPIINQQNSLISDFTNGAGHVGTARSLGDDEDSNNDSDDKSAIDHDKLADMKRQALAHLEPLADKLDGTPEETFKTTMMMIQANDNHTLLGKALEAAKKIPDDKVRAQAMLDIINEINYFSQN